MTTKAENAATEKEATKAALDARAKEIEAKEKELNAGKTGKGLRTFIGLTRGRNPQMFEWNGFDDTLPETLPATTDEFLAITKVADDKVIVKLLIDGWNAMQFDLGSDPVGEFVDKSWPEDVQKSFKLMVKGYAANAGVSIEDAVNIMKPGIVAAQAKLAKAMAENAAEAAAESVPAPVAEKSSGKARK
jgi:hypothetical protein